MSSAAVPFPAVGERERAENAEERLRKAALQLRAGGPVIFKWSRRVPAKLIPRWQRAFYVVFCRKAKGRLKTPPGPAMQLNAYTTLGRAADRCETPDDQILVMPLDRDYYRPDVLELAVECRPKDPADAKRFEILRSVFGGYVGGDDPILREQVEEMGRDAERLIEKCRHV